MSEKQKLLIVDDSELNRDILKEILGSRYDYMEAENGTQAIQILEVHPEIDLMLLDINMPQMNGFQVLEHMRELQWIDEVPVVMISSEESVEIMRKAYDLGITDYISRPFDAVIVKKRVQNTLGLYANQKRLINVVVDQIYEKEENSKIHTFSYMSACFYLYQISKDNKYLDTIVKISKKFTDLSEHSKRMLADTYIILKRKCKQTVLN